MPHRAGVGINFYMKATKPLVRGLGRIKCSKKLLLLMLLGQSLTLLSMNYIEGGCVYTTRFTKLLWWSAKIK